MRYILTLLLTVAIILGGCTVKTVDPVVTTQGPADVGSRAIGNTGTTNLGILTVGGLLTAEAGLSVTGQADFADWVNLSAATTVVVTAGSTITAAGTYQPISSASAVTTSTATAVADGSETGDLLILRNVNAADAITVDGTGGNVECKADIVMGAGDTITLIWNGSDWNCLAVYDNS